MKAAAPRLWLEVGRLALRAFAHEWRLALLAIGAVVAVVAPLMILFGLRTGYVEGQSREILADPRGLGLFPGNLDGRYDDAWIAAMRARPDVRFVAPRLSYLSARIQLRVPGTEPVEVQLVPSGCGDPMLDGLEIPHGYGEVALSAGAARALGATLGGRVEAVIEGMFSRELGESERLQVLPVRVVAVVPEAREEDAVAFASEALVLATEDFKSSYPVPALGWSGRSPAPAERSYSSYRMYAESLYDVLPLRDELERQGYRVLSNAERIQDLLRIHSALDRSALVVALIAALGALFCIGANFYAEVERRQHQLCVLRLLGLSRLLTGFFPLVHASAVACVGVVASVLLAAAGAALLNRWLAGDLLQCLLHPQHLAGFVLATFAGVLAAASLAAVRAVRVDPAEGLRRV